jgi:hypothetical protein
MGPGLASLARDDSPTPHEKQRMPDVIATAASRRFDDFVRELARFNESVRAPGRAMRRKARRLSSRDCGAR